MTEKTMPVTGGCLCGAVRYEAIEPPHHAEYCHCNTCKKARGGIFAAHLSTCLLIASSGHPNLFALLSSKRTMCMR